jgi:DNA-binding MarR family transcriptional regulator
LKRITTNETAVLRALADGQLHTVPELLALGRLPANRSPQGIHESAASLARKGLVEKSRDHGRVLLKLTPAGRDLIEEASRV